MKPSFLDRRIYMKGEYLGELLMKPFQLFAATESSGGILMLAAAIIALIWANSSLNDFYKELWKTAISVGLDKGLFEHSLHFWINEGLMTLFFLL